MEIGMTLPSMVSGLDRDTILEWCRRVDEGPFSTLAVGERIAYPNVEMFTTLAAAAAVTQRVTLMTTIVVLPAHPAIEVAKMAATIDVISAGRLRLGVGIGGRGEDFRALERSDAKRHQMLDEQVATMRRVWAGAAPAEGISPVGPAPVRAGGPPLYSGALGPKATARAARWAEGVAGFVLDPIGQDHAATFRMVEDAWSAAGRSERPRHVTSFWYALAADGATQLKDYASRYLAIFGAAVGDSMADLCTASNAGAVTDAVKRLEDAGCDELILVPTSADLAELDRLVDLVC
ncbi:MAG TPA: LLM class flavin-dependent oxidoreductase [Mycobacteriales bacterium]|nr:LLM class flavin-dependent oxidoreductase [Mycobacteriales bacterium]